MNTIKLQRQPVSVWFVVGAIALVTILGIVALISSGGFPIDQEQLWQVYSQQREWYSPSIPLVRCL